MLLNYKVNEAAAQAGEPPLVVAHGLFGSARNWGGLGRAMATRRDVAVVDMRNHGESPHDDRNDYPAMAGDLGEVIDALGGRADLLGHSMGGKAAMTLALREPEKLRKLVVADIAPVAYAHTQLEPLEAMAAVDLSAVSRRSDADRAMAATAPDRTLRGFLLQSLAIEDGRARWRLNLDALRRHMDDIIGFPEVDGRFDGPVLFISGGASDYMTEAHEPRVLELFPRARFEVIEGAGHWLHAEKPAEFAAAVTAFLDEG